MILDQREIGTCDICEFPIVRTETQRSIFKECGCSLRHIDKKAAARVYRDWAESGLVHAVYAGTFTLRAKSPDDHLGAVEGDKS